MSDKLSLRRNLVIYLVLIHVLFAVVALATVRDTTILILVEAGFLLSLVLGYRLVRALSVPSEFVRTGADMIDEGEFTSHFRDIGQPEVDRLLGVYNKMIDRLREERLRVREKNEFLDRLVLASPGGVVVCDFESLITEINPAAQEMLGVPADRALGQPPREFPALAPLESLDPGRSRVISLSGGRRVRGTRGQFRDRGFPRTFFLLEELTEELRRSEKEAYGQVIRTVSHEVNNTIGPVASLVDSVGRYGERLGAEDRERFEAGLAVASQRLDHLRSFVEGFADVVRLPPPSVEPCDLGRMVEEVLLLTEPLFDERRIECSWKQSGDLRAIEFDKNQIEQVLLNVLKNAAEAIGHDGRIAVRAGETDGKRWLEVRDDGPGLDEKTLRSVFRPFFSTKEHGRGLGLTLVNEILTNHGFGFSLENAEQGGAVFRVAF